MAAGDGEFITAVRGFYKERNVQPYEELEKKWAEWNHLDPVGMVVCSSGTAALHLALECVFQHQEVYTSDYNMIAVPRAIKLSGKFPRFSDHDVPDPHWPKIGHIVVHVYGRKPWRVYPDSTVIEDLAEAHGISPREETNAACWSFYKNKIVAGEEGGAVWFRDPYHAVIARELRSLGFTPDHNYRHRPRGHNYRLSNCHAELILRSLAKVDDNIKRRQDGVGWMDEFIPEQWKQPPRDANWVYDLRIPGLKRNQMTEIVRLLNEWGIGARHGFYPMTGQEEFRDETGPKRNPNAWLAADEVFYLPIPFIRQHAREMMNSLLLAVATAAPLV